MEVCVHARVPMDPSSIASFNGEMFVQLCIEFPRSCACKKKKLICRRENVRHHLKTYQTYLAAEQLGHEKNENLWNK